MTTAPARRHLVRLIVGVLIAILLGAVVIAAPWKSATPLPPVVYGSGTSATQPRTLPAFHAIDLAGTNHATVVVGGRPSVVVTADDNLLSHVVTTVDDGTLRIGDRGSFRVSRPMSVTVVAPALNAVLLSGTGSIDVQGASATRFAVTLDGTGAVQVSGRVVRLSALLSGTGAVRLAQLDARDATARVLGTGSIQLNATHSLDATVRGTGAIVYSGNPEQVRRSVSGTGSVSAR